MNRIAVTVAILASLSLSATAQEYAGGLQCAKMKSHAGPVRKGTVADPAEEQYDMQYVKLDLNLTNLSTQVSGSATTRAKVISASMPAYVFELSSQLTIDSVKVNAQLLTVTGADSIRTVTLPAALTQGTIFTAQVFYHGQPVAGGGFFGGLSNATSPSWGTQVTYTVSESYHAMNWWPCKQSLQDKIDSSDVWMTVDASLKAGSNGVLKNITNLGAGLARYEWSQRHPIDYYLISVAVAPYVDYSYYMHYANSNDSTLVQNYVYNNPATLPNFKDVIDSTGMMIDYFSTIYGRYPFWQEKYGHCMAPLSGGMEHQTMTTLGYFEGTLIAHELAHQWFGDNVTCGSWADIWVNEGEASYSEYLYVKHFWGNAAAFQYMRDYHDDIKQSIDGTVYCDDTTDENRIFDGRLTYHRGASALHTLHFLCGSDSIYYQVCKNYQQQLGGGTGLTGDIKSVAENVVGQNLDTFFTQWIYKEGWPIYSAKWAQVGTQVTVQLNQTTSKPSSVSLYATPIEVRLKRTGGDTTIRIYNNQAQQNYVFNWNQTMTGMEVDPNDWILKDVTSVTNDQTLSIAESVAGNIKVYPNPAHEAWVLQGSSEALSLQLSDVSGRLIWQGQSNTQATTIPAASLSAGIYILHIAGGKNEPANIKLVKQ